MRRPGRVPRSKDSEFLCRSIQSVGEDPREGGADFCYRVAHGAVGKGNTMTSNTTKRVGIILTALAASALTLGISSPVANARDGCDVGYHPNPDNTAQCVANGTSGLQTSCNPGQHDWYDPYTKAWNPC